MSFSPQSLGERLRALAADAAVPTRYIVAFSGGLDSTVLLHALVNARPDCDTVAVHVNHRLQADASLWAESCAKFAESLNVEFRAVSVDVDPDFADGPEAAARAARYAALERFVGDGDWLLSAHHQDDQAETLLLNLMRGSGPAGLAGIVGIRKFANGWLARPMLDVTRDALHRYATDMELDWIDDVTNVDQRFDRNYVRHEVLPLLESRWPGSAGRLAKSARLSRDANELLAQLAELDMQSLGNTPARLDIEALSQLPDARQRNVIRYAVRQLGLPPPQAIHIAGILSELMPARDDAAPIVSWSGALARRYRKHLYLLARERSDTAAAAEGVTLAPDAGVDLGIACGHLSLENSDGRGLATDVVNAGLTVRFRQGGEEIKLLEHKHTKKLKKLLQEEGVVPWMRDRLPLVYSNERLVAVADLWIAAGAESTPGHIVCWRNRPPIH